MLSDQEVTDCTEEERPVLEAALQSITPEQRAKLPILDALLIVRGYWTYVPRQEETNKAFKMICDWRDRVDFYNYLRMPVPYSDEFHTCWPESVYGKDKYGHRVIAMKIADIDTDSLGKIPEDMMCALQGQKMQSYGQYKLDSSLKEGVRRYKHIVIIEGNGVGMSLLSGKKRNIIKKIFAVGADFFPESIWKIYVVNAPLMFRAVWAVIKPWLHPITVAKVHILGSYSAAIKAMTADGGLTVDALPDWMGGTCKGTPIRDILREQILSNNPNAFDPDAPKYKLLGSPVSGNVGEEPE